MQRAYSDRSRGIAVSKAVEIANGLLRAGETRSDIITLNDGELDFDTPAEVIEATVDALRRGRTRYDDLLGLAALRTSICRKLRHENGVESSPDEILVTNGSSQAIFEIFQTFINPGDEVVVPVPCWPTYLEGIRQAGGVPVPHPCTAPDIDPDALAARISPRTRMLVVNTPHNPTGAVYSRTALERIVGLAAARDLLILADEAYEAFTFGERAHHSIAALAGRERDRVLTTRSFSKSYAMTGYRIGYVHASRDIIGRLAALHAHMTDNVCTFAQYGAARALNIGSSATAGWCDALRARTALAAARLDAALPCRPPAGAFYLFPDITHLLGARFPDAVAFCNRLLEETGVAVVPGEAFAMAGHIRISVAGAGMDGIAAGCDRIAAFVRDAQAG